MSDGDRRNRHPHLGGFGVVAAIFLSCMVVGVVAFSEGRQSKQQEQKAEAAAAATKGYVAKPPQQAETGHAGVPALAEAFISNPEPKSADEREKRDLAAQENTAAWAFWMTGFTAVQVLMSGAGLAALIVTIRQGHAALREARAANEISQDIGQRDLRAYVGATDIRVTDMMVGHNPTFHHILNNFGSTPAMQVKVWATIEYVKGEPHSVKSWFKGKYGRNASSYLNPGETRPSQFTMPEPLSPMQAQEILNGEAAYVYVGIIQYRDLSGKKRWTLFSRRTFARYLQPDGSGPMVNTPKHNCVS